LEKIFGKKEEPVEELPKKQDFNIEDAEKVLSENFNESFQSFNKDANKIYKEMQPIITNIQKNLKDLGKAKYKDKVDPQLLQNVIGHRKSFIHKMEVMLEKARKPMEKDFDSIIEFNKSLHSSVSDVNMKAVKDYHFLKILFEKEVKKTLENFKTLNKTSDKLTELVKENKEKLSLINNAQKELKSLKDEIKDLDKTEKSLKTLENKLSDLKSKQDSLKKDLENFDKRKDWIDLQQLLEKRKATEEKISNLKSVILQETSRINKPLRKFKNLIDRGIVKIKEEETLERSVDSIVDTLIKEKDPKSMTFIVKKIQENISNGKIELKDKEKTLDEIENILKNNLFESFVKDYISLTKDLKKLEKNITNHKSSILKKKLKDQIKNTKKQIEETNTQIEKLQKKAEKTRESIEDKKTFLEKTLSRLTEKETTITVL
jgi:hypothetical protein